ncbi:MAG TPA: VWA domain-containing protein [Polyangiaceae bacterium]|nr:VWA domain-containing protein [Polyangiaceae bacterium]
MRKLLCLAALVVGCGHATLPTAQIATSTGVSIAASPQVPALPAPRLVGALGQKTLPALRDTALVVRFSVDANARQPVARPPLNVALCIDTSGSMEGKAIDDARKAALAFLDGLKPGDGFSVVTFDQTARVVVPATRVGVADMKKIRASIEQIQAQGTTAMTEGLALAIQQVRGFYDASRVNRVVLVSDGVPNDAAQLRTLATQAAASNISVSTMGLGLDYDELLMGDLAQAGGGRFKYIDDSSKIATVLEQELSRISRVSARNASLLITPGPGVTIDSAVGLQMARLGGNAVQVYLGDVSLGTTRDVYLRVHVHGRRDGSAVEIADATLSFLTSDGRSEQAHVFLGAHASSDDAVVGKDRDEDVDRGAKQAQQAADAIEAIRRARDTDKARPVHSLSPPPANAPLPASPAEIKRDHAAAFRTLMGD